MTHHNLAEWRDYAHNADYPLVDGSSRQTEDGLTLPLSLLLDACLYPAEFTGPLYLSALQITTHNIRFVIGDAQRRELLFGDVPLASPQELILLYDRFQRPAGSLLVSVPVLISLPSWGRGLRTFRRTQAVFVGSCVLPAATNCVTGLQVSDTVALSGSPWLIGDTGVVLQVEDISLEGKAAKKLRIHAVGEPLNRRHNCLDAAPGENTEPPHPIRGVRVVTETQDFVCYPDEYGNIQLSVSDAGNEKPALRLVVQGDSILVQVAGSLKAGSAKNVTG